MPVTSPPDMAVLWSMPASIPMPASEPPHMALECAELNLPFHMQSFSRLHSTACCIGRHRIAVITTSSAQQRRQRAFWHNKLPGTKQPARLESCKSPSACKGSRGDCSSLSTAACCWCIFNVRPTRLCASSITWKTVVSQCGHRSYQE